MAFDLLKLYAKRETQKGFKYAKDDALMKEFEKEVSMLDKFRNDYVIHFYGAVIIPGKICMVTEFAQHITWINLLPKVLWYISSSSLQCLKTLLFFRGVDFRLHSNLSPLVQ